MESLNKINVKEVKKSIGTAMNADYDKAASQLVT